MITGRPFPNTRLAALACLTAFTFAPVAVSQELRRIEQPEQESSFASFSESESGYGEFQPSVFRYAELEAEQSDQAVPQPAFDGDYGKYGYAGCHSYGSNLAVIGGVEATFLFPILDSGRASVEVDDNFNGFATRYTSDEVKLDDDLFISPRVWVGLQHCSGWSLVSRLFWLDGSESDFTPDTPFFLQSHVASARLEAYTFDVELSKSWCNHYGNQRYAAIGFRYAELETAELVEAHAEINGDFVQGFAQTERFFDGPGFTIAYGGSKNCCSCCGVELFFNLRGSFLFGDVRNAAQTTAWVFDPGVVPGTANDFSTAVAEADDMLFIGEVQVGGRWEHQLQCCCARAFVSTAVEYQYWLADDAFAAAGSTAFTDDAEITALATAGDLELNMIGVTIGTGLIW